MAADVDAATLKGWLSDGSEIALLDTREYGQYGMGHLFFAAPLPYSRFELGLPALVPNPAVRLVLAGLRVLLPRRLPGWLRASGAVAATLNWAVVTPASIEVCHRLGVAVFVWTVNEPALATTLVASGIDGIITDDPGIFAGET